VSRVHIRPLSPVTLCLLGLATVAGTANASGFRIPEASIAGLGTANALVANSSELGALAYNPAGQSYHEGVNVVAGVIAIDPSLNVTTASGAHESDVDTPFYAPSLYITGQLGNNLSLGLNLNSPFGLETNWPTGTFPTFSGPLAPAQPTRSKVEMANFNPNLAYKIGSNTSVAAGIDYYWVKDVRLDIASGSGKISGNGADYGMNIAMLHKAGNWAFGGSYRSAVSLDIDGTVSGVTPAKAELDFPWMLQVGTRLQANDKLAVELDIERTGWNKFNQIRVLNAATGASITTNTNAWKAANAYRLGMTYQLSAGTQLRIGYTYDETPQVDEYFSARIPDADRHLLGLGASQKVGNWTIEGGYMYVKFKDRDYTGARAYVPAQDTNGTTALNGSYSADVHLFGLGASTRF
jgi:long-chain fatty acid transport protein